MSSRPGRFRVSFLLALAIPTAASTVTAQSIRGLVLERYTETPVELATVVVITEDGDSVAAALTDDNGFFSLPTGRDAFVLHVTALGYRASRAGPYQMRDQTAARVVEVSMVPAPIAIEGVIVDAIDPSLVSTGFYDRMDAGKGQFLTPADILLSGARFTHEVFHDLDHVMPQYAAPVWERTVQFMAATGRGNCEPRIYIDGVWLRERLPTEGLDDVIPVEELLAAEVYWGPFQAPMRYQGTMIDNSCGVVLLWTREW